MTTSLLVTVGTDHHPFDRLVRWVESWVARQPEGEVECFMQVGSSQAPKASSYSEYLDFDDMTQRMRGATAVVCHGGPATIMDARRFGRLPIVVPREHDRGEHVDDHQVVFTSTMGELDQIALARTEAELHQLLDAAVTDPQAFRLDDRHSHVDEAIQRFTELVDEVLAGRRRGRLFRPGARAHPAAPDRPAGDGWRVLYVGGWGRSGSTLLDRMLGQVPGVVAVGEAREVFLRGCVENRLCGCGVPFDECAFWTAVGERAFGGWAQVDARAMGEMRHRLDRPWQVPFLLLPWRSRRQRSQASTYVGALEQLYAAIAEVSGADVVVDSSKIPSYALLLERALPRRVRAVHLVRDSRGVVFSWQKHVNRTDGAASDTMVRYGVLAAAARYDLYNGMAHLMRGGGVPTVRVRYEDLVAEPAAAVATILRHAGARTAAADLTYLQQDAVQLVATHTVDGNPMRFQTGAVPLLVDDEWRRAMAPADRAIVAVVTAPLLLVYGYLNRRSRRRAT
ncbi:MAG: glycosyltransferase [Acidimicrobiales bacterium]